MLAASLSQAGTQKRHTGDTSRFVWQTALATIHLINQSSEKTGHATKMFVDDV